MGRAAIADGFELLDQTVLTGKPGMRRADLEGETGGRTVGDGVVRRLQMGKQGRFDVLCFTDEYPFPRIRQSIDTR